MFRKEVENLVKIVRGTSMLGYPYSSLAFQAWNAFPRAVTWLDFFELDVTADL
jgi:hypothetical protein